MLELYALIEKMFPKKELNPADKDMERSDAICLKSNHVFFTKWLDNRSVHMIWNFLAVDPKHEVKRRFHGSREKITNSCPIVIQNYNEYKKVSWLP